MIKKIEGNTIDGNFHYMKIMNSNRILFKDYIEVSVYELPNDRCSYKYADWEIKSYRLIGM